MRQKTLHRDVEDQPTKLVEEFSVEQQADATAEMESVNDDYGRWLFEHTGSVDQALDLEF